MLAVLRQRNFALVWLAGLISLTGDWFLLVALPYVVYDFTGSAAATAATVATRVLPRLLLGTVAGLFLQRVVPDEFRGRVFGSLIAAISLALLIGSGVAGALGNRVDITIMLSAQAVSFPLAGLFALLTLAPSPITPSEPARANPEASS